jgi:hypothetical protein
MGEGSCGESGGFGEDTLGDPFLGVASSEMGAGGDRAA